MRKSAPIIPRDACIQEASRPYIFLVHGAAKRVLLAITSARHRTTGGDPKALLSARERPIDSQSRICEPEKHIMQIAAFCRKSAALIALLGVAGGALAADTWRVATEGTFPPFEFYDSNTGELQGFEVDLVKEMAKVMGKDLKLDSMSCDAIIPALISGTVDAGAAGFSITPERLSEIRNERRPGSRYASLANCREEIAAAEDLMRREGIRWLNSTPKSIEEISATIIAELGLDRRQFV